MYLAEQLSKYALSVNYNDLHADVIHTVKQRLVDSIACALGTFDEEPVRKIRKVTDAVAVPMSTVIGTRKKTTPDLAAFINGTMVRYLDFNDGYIGKARETGHASDNIPACMAVAESEHLTGKDLILSIVLAYEIQSQFQDAANLLKRGWDHVNYVLISSSIATGKLMRLSQGELAQAVNIALNGHIAMRQARSGELSAWKGISAANAARNGVFAALLARQGLSGPSPIFEGKMGFFKQITGEFEIDPKLFGNIQNNDFAILRSLTKLLPTNGELQTAVWAAFELRKQINDISDIVAVEIDTTDVGYNILAKDPEKWCPQSRETADHSLPFTVARALMDGEITRATYSDEKIKDPDVIEFMKIIKVSESGELSAMFPKYISNRVTIRLASGEVLSKQVNEARGVPGNPMTDEDFENKFEGLVKESFTSSQRKNILDHLWHIDEQKDLTALFEALVIQN